MNHLIVRFAISLLLLLCFSMTITAQKQGGEEQTAQQEIQNGKPDAVNRKTTNGKSQAEKPLNAGQKTVNDSAVDNNLADSMLESTITSTPDTDIEPIESAGFHQALKTKFIEGNAGFMSLVALALVIGLAFCIERIIYLSLSEINAKQFMRDLEAKINTGDIEAAKDLCRDTRGPVASILRFGAGCQLRKRLLVDYAFHRDGTVIRIPRHRDRYGNGFRSDSVSRRHQPYHCGFGNESGPHHNDFWYHRSPDFTDIL